jgi:hypothetical protein
MEPWYITVPVPVAARLDRLDAEIVGLNPA